MASKAAKVCVPCLAYVCVAMLSFTVLLAGSLYYGGVTLQSVWTVGRQRGIGLREVALQGFKRSGVDEKGVLDVEGRVGGGMSVEDSEAETHRLIAREREP